MTPKLRAAVPLIPPTTPNPVPTTSATDRPYAHADSGVSLQSYIWGDDSPLPALKNQPSEPPPKDEFIIAWSEEEKSWVAIYELHASVTIVVFNRVCHFKRQGSFDSFTQQNPARCLTAKSLPFEETSDPEIVNSDGEDEDIMHGMVEVNLLSGLNDGVTFTSSELPMSLPSSRVGPTIRRQAFSMAPLLSPVSGSDKHHSPSSSSILRKSYRKTLRTVEGIKVRMRSCYVPFVPSTVLNGGDDDLDASEEDEDAGSEERTVILSVEMENSNESGLGFFIEQVNINLLYSVSSLSPPHRATPHERKRQSTLSNASDGSIDGMQRSVAIVVKGHPYRPEDPTQEGSVPIHLETFSSRWTCVLDLVATQQADPNSWYSRPSSPLSTRDALPMPASPYPATFSSGPYQRERDRNSQTSSKMFSQKPRPVSSPLAPNGATAVSHRTSAGATLSSTGRFVPSPPSAVVAAMSGQTNNAGPSSLRFDKSAIAGAASSPVPLTPAFPSYSEGPPAPSNFQSPLGPVIDNSSLPHEAYRERLGSTIVPAAAQPRDGGTTYQGGEMAGNMLVSVTLLPPLRSSDSPRRIKRRIFPMDVFSLEVFVLNVSPIVRRCEVGYPEMRRRRQGTAVDLGGKSTAGGDAIGQSDSPLLPGSSQSVRIRVLALSPGVHMIDALTVTDIATSYTINLR
ncbi:hypothetical protein BS47DRAFT_1393797 [Hydnum rufescens UP504]|uniref:Uncharacterized protein n=1 Tax=Hydnum rufescens UP504 TaxID=1448309 RepID=A0A9P6AVQ8_9AGAM|nr:hypothetical protein BS47DRAFT_1393797 [Hydnum rufescens UP504]